MVEEHIFINDIEVPKLTDKDGINWYPLKMMLTKVLKRQYKPKDFVNTVISYYMQVVPYKFLNSTVRTWFINETGLKIILQNISSHSKDSYEKELALDGACVYFNIKRKTESTIIYKKMIPDFTLYKKWDAIILKFDKDINNDTIWKKCDKCNNYYPDNKKYFMSYINRYKKTITRPTCLKCAQKDFLIENKDLKILYKNNELLMAENLYEKKYLLLASKLFLENKKYSLDIFHNPNVLYTLLPQIREAYWFNTNQYNLKYLSKHFNIPIKEFSRIINNTVEIGYFETLPKHLKKIKVKTISKKTLTDLCHKTFCSTINASKLKNIDCKPIIGIITSNGLYIIAEEECKCKHAKIIKYSKIESEMLKQIAIIKRGEYK